MGFHCMVTRKIQRPFEYTILSQSYQKTKKNKNRYPYRTVDEQFMFTS